MLDLLFPPTCLGCGDLSRVPLCPTCAGAPAWFVPPAGLRAAWGAAAFDSGVGAALKRAKYGHDRQAFQKLSRWMTQLATPALHAREYAAIVPVPSPWTRRAGRGFNPSWLLAAALSQSLDVPLVPALVRQPGGQRQARLDARDRRRNVSSQLGVRRAPTGNVLLVDDVVTTGSTASACAVLLDKADDIDVACLCRVGVRELGSQNWNDVQDLERPTDVRNGSGTDEPRIFR